MKTTEKHLYYLSELSDYTIDGDYPDIRNWPVKDSDLRTIGTVRKLVVDRSTEKIVYLDVEVDSSIIDAGQEPYGRPDSTDVGQFANAEGEDHVLVPIGLVDINMAEEYVFTESIDHGTFAGTKRKHADAPIGREYETAVLGSYGRGNSHGALDKRADSDIEDTKIGRAGRGPEREPPIGERMDADIRDTEDGGDDSPEAIEERRRPGRTSETAERETDRSDAGSEGPKDPDGFRDDFYARREFDDTKLHKGKK